MDWPRLLAHFCLCLFEEDIDGFSRPEGQASGASPFGEPLDLSQELGSSRTRQAAAKLTASLEGAIQGLMTRDA